MADGCTVAPEVAAQGEQQCAVLALANMHSFLCCRLVNNNRMNGTLPATLVTSAPSLAVLNAGYNPALDGTLPAAWAQSRNLRRLALQGISLHGDVPFSWSSMLQLSSLDVRDNHAMCGLLPAFPLSLLLSIEGTMLGRSCSGAGQLTGDIIGIIVGEWSGHCMWSALTPHMQSYQRAAPASPMSASREPEQHAGTRCTIPMGYCCTGQDRYLSRHMSIKQGGTWPAADVLCMSCYATVVTAPPPAAAALLLLHTAVSVVGTCLLCLTAYGIHRVIKARRKAADEQQRSLLAAAAHGLSHKRLTPPPTPAHPGTNNPSGSSAPGSPRTGSLVTMAIPALPPLAMAGGALGSPGRGPHHAAGTDNHSFSRPGSPGDVRIAALKQEVRPLSPLGQTPPLAPLGSPRAIPALADAPPQLVPVVAQVDAGAE
jgi:hypothetical protein